MNKQTINLTIVSVLLVVLLSACGSTASILPQQVNQLLNVPRSVIAQPTTVPDSPVTDEPATTAPQPELLAAYEDALENVYTQVNPSVVNIRVLQMSNQLTPDAEWLPGLPQIPGFPNMPEDSEPQVPQYNQGMGSGFVWDKEGHIITNNHVIADADKIEVTFYDGAIVQAELVGADPYSDLAVLKVDVPADQLHPVQVADSGQVKVGELAIAIGNPFGLEGTMTVGIVSALGRSIPASEGSFSGPAFTIPDVIQTDAPINPGNSGGVLLNDLGQLIGVTAAIESPVRANAGIGFAIPSAIVGRVVPSLIATGNYQHPYLGISGMALTPDLAEAMDLQPEQRGALVGAVVPDGPADKAGLRGSEHQAIIDGQSVNVGGDVIVAVNGESIRDMDDLIAYLTGKTEVGQTVEMTILRDGKEMVVEVTLEARPGQNEELTPVEEARAGVWLGIVGQDLTSDIAEAMNLSQNQQGVLVQQVEIGSPADQAGLRGSEQLITIDGENLLVGGDVITALDDQSVETIEDLRALLGQSEPGDKVTLTILRDGEQLTVSVTLAERPTGK